MISNMALLSKDLLSIVWNVFLIVMLFYLISHIVMAIIKTIFCDVQIKLYRTWSKRLKHYMNDEELEKVLSEKDIERKK